MLTFAKILLLSLSRIRIALIEYKDGSCGEIVHIQLPSSFFKYVSHHLSINSHTITKMCFTAPLKIYHN